MSKIRTGCSSRHANPDIGPAPPQGPLMVALVIEGRRVLVVGGGAISARRVRSLLAAGAQVHVVAPLLNAEIRSRVRKGEITAEKRPFADADLADAHLVLAAIDDSQESERIAHVCRARGIPVHVADRPPLCDFIFPALHREGPVQIAVSTGGMGPALAARIRDRIAISLPADLGPATRRFGDLRAAIRKVDPEDAASERRMDWLKRKGRSLPLSVLARLKDADLAALVAEYRERPATPSVQRPRVQLVGAGPGDPRLLTLAALDALAEADLVLADRLVPLAIRKLARGEVRVAKKTPGQSETAQAELHRWMLEGATAGLHVVRLKCGDPYLFGRGAEEVAFLAGHGIEAEVIPGISSALAGPAAAGIPVTARHLADRVVVVTGHGHGGRAVDFPSFREDQTTVVLMGLGRLDALVEAMLATGAPADWPAAIVCDATHPGQRSLTAPLSLLPSRAREAGLTPPGVVIIGRVVECAEAASQREIRATG
jgi:uroporphyrin-III C-methyltransferase